MTSPEELASDDGEPKTSFASAKPIDPKNTFRNLHFEKTVSSIT